MDTTMNNTAGEDSGAMLPGKICRPTKPNANLLKLVQGIGYVFKDITSRYRQTGNDSCDVIATLTGIDDREAEVIWSGSNYGIWIEDHDDYVNWIDPYWGDMCTRISHRVKEEYRLQVKEWEEWEIANKNDIAELERLREKLGYS